MIGLWVDDVRTPPEHFYYMGKPVHWERAWDVEGAKAAISEHEQYDYRYDLLSVDHDAGDYGPPDYIKLLDWLEETGRILRIINNLICFQFYDIIIIEKMRKERKNNYD